MSTISISDNKKASKHLIFIFFIVIEATVGQASARGLATSSKTNMEVLGAIDHSQPRVLNTN